MNSNKISIAFACAAILAAMLACGGPLQVGGPTPEYSPVPVSTEAIQSLDDKFEALGVASGEVTVTLTETELTSLFDQQLQAQPDSAFSDPQVYLRDGKIKLYITLTTNNLTGKALVVMNATIVDNKLQVAIESADFGPLPVPQGILDSLAATINDQLLAAMSGLPTGVGLKNIVIADGTLTITTIVK